MEDTNFIDVAPSSEMDLEDATPRLRSFSKRVTGRKSPGNRVSDGADLLILDDDIAMILDTPSPKRVASPRSDSDVEMSTSKPPRRKRRTLISHRTATTASQQQQQQQQQQPINNPSPLQHRQRRKLIHRNSAASEDGMNDDIDMDSILKGTRGSRQGSVGSEASTGPTEDAGVTAATDNKTKPSRRRRLRPQNALAMSTTAHWRSISQHGAVDIADDEDMSGTFRMGSERGSGIGQSIASGANPIQPIVLGTSEGIQQQHPSSSTPKRGRRRRQMRTEALAEKIDRFSQHQDLVDLSQHLYIPSSVSSQQLAAKARNSKHPIVVDDDDEDDDGDDDDNEEDACHNVRSPPSPEEEVDDDVMIIEPDHRQEYHDDVNRVTSPSLHPPQKQSNEIPAVAPFSSPGLQEIEQQQQEVLRSEPVNTPIATDTQDVAQSTAVTQATVPSEQDQDQATYIGRVIGSVSKFFLGY